MSARSVTCTALLASVLIVACDGAAESVRPRISPPAVDPPVVDRSVLSMLEVVPSSIRIEEGWEMPLDIIPRDQRGERMPAGSGLTVSSSDTAVATLHSAPIVVGVSAGTADITVTQTIAGVTRSVTIKATILEATPAADVVLTADSLKGWFPPVAHVKLGGTVKWLTAGPVGWSGAPHRILYFSIGNGGVVDSLDLSTGFATRIYKAPGVYRYCSGGCWDPPDGGVIYVR